MHERPDLSAADSASRKDSLFERPLTGCLGGRIFGTISAWITVSMLWSD